MNVKFKIQHSKFIILLLSLSFTLNAIGQIDSNSGPNSSSMSGERRIFLLSKKITFDEKNYISFQYQCGYKNKLIYIDQNGMAYFQWGSDQNLSTVSFSIDTTLVAAIKDIIVPTFFNDVKGDIPIDSPEDGCSYVVSIVNNDLNSTYYALIEINKEGKYKCSSAKFKKLINLLNKVNDKYGFAKY
jgi:hypothetical protein